MRSVAFIAAIIVLVAGLDITPTAEAKGKKRQFSATCTGVTLPSGHRKCVMGFRLSGGHRNPFAFEPYVYRRFYGNYPDFDDRTFYDRVFPHD